MLSQEESRDIARSHEDRERVIVKHVSLPEALKQVWFLLGYCPFEAGDTLTVKGVTYVVTGFSGSGNQPTVACEVRPVAELLR